jgi:hypothetical protein
MLNTYLNLKLRLLFILLFEKIEKSERYEILKIFYGMHEIEADEI